MLGNAVLTIVASGKPVKLKRLTPASRHDLEDIIIFRLKWKSEKRNRTWELSIDMHNFTD
jgi:hypothetical protein